MSFFNPLLNAGLPNEPVNKTKLSYLDNKTCYLCSIHGISEERGQSWDIDKILKSHLK